MSVASTERETPSHEGKINDFLLCCTRRMEKLKHYRIIQHGTLCLRVGNADEGEWKNNFYHPEKPNFWWFSASRVCRLLSLDVVRERSTLCGWVSTFMVQKGEGNDIVNDLITTRNIHFLPLHTFSRGLIRTKTGFEVWNKAEEDDETMFIHWNLLFTTADERDDKNSENRPALAFDFVIGFRWKLKSFSLLHNREPPTVGKGSREIEEMTKTSNL